MTDITIGKTQADLNKPKKTGRPKVPINELVDKKESLVCSCGVLVRRDNISQHRKSNKHKLIISKYATSENEKFKLLENELITIKKQLKNIQLKIDYEKTKLTL